MCESLCSHSSSTSTSSDSEKPDLKEAFTILQLEVNKSALNLAANSEISSSTRSTDITDATGDTDVGEIELKICQDVDELHSGKGDCSCGDESMRKRSPCSSRQVKLEDCQELEQESSLEYTLAVIKREALIYRKEIERLMLEEGFNICQTRWLQLTPEQASDFYFDNYEQESFAQLVSCMSSGPILVYVISKTDGIEHWKKLIGPENVKNMTKAQKISEARIYAPDSIRGKYGRVENEMEKLVHGSADKNSADKEIKYFFPERKIEIMPREDAAVQYLWRVINEALTEALIKCCEEKPEDPIVWLGNWLLDYKSNTPKYLCMNE